MKHVLSQARAPAFTVDAVVSECLFLLQRSRLDPIGLFDLLDKQTLIIEPRTSEETARMLALCRKYGDVPMSWADGALVVLSERYPNAALATFDSDFLVYRRFKSEKLPLVRP